jgi:hypothetical protein
MLMEMFAHGKAHTYTFAIVSYFGVTFGEHFGIKRLAPADKEEDGLIRAARAKGGAHCLSKRDLQAIPVQRFAGVGASFCDSRRPLQSFKSRARGRPRARPLHIVVVLNQS